MRLSRSPACFLGALLLTTTIVFGICPDQVQAQAMLDPGGTIRDIIANPNRDEVYLTLDTDEMLKVDLGSQSVTARITVAGGPDQMAISPDGTMLYVGLVDTYDVAVFNLVNMSFLDTIDLSATWPIKGMVAGSDRLYISLEISFAIADTINNVEIFNESLGGFRRCKLHLSADEQRLFGQDFDVSASSFYGYDVSSGEPQIFTRECNSGSVGSNGKNFVLSQDESQAFVVSSYPFALQIHEIPPAGPMVTISDVPVAADYDWLTSMAASPDRSLFFVATTSRKLAVVRASDWLPFHVEDIACQIMDHGLVVNHIGSKLAAACATSLYPDRLAFFDISELPPENRGGFKLRPVDDINGLPVLGAALVDSEDLGASSEFIEYRNGVLGTGPIEPGIYAMEIASYGYESWFGDVAITSGAWTELGEIRMVRTQPHYAAPYNLCGSPAATVGETTALQIHGRGFHPDVVLQEAPGEYVTLLDYTWIDWATLDATVEIPPDSHLNGVLHNAFNATNPGTSYETGRMLIMPGPDQSVSFASAQATVSEDSENISIEVHRLYAPVGDITVDYQTMDGTATAGDDYTYKSGSVFWPSGNNDLRFITVPILQDAVPEGPETFTVELSNPTGGVILGDITMAEVTIEDTNSSTVRFSAATTGVAESDDSVSLTVSRTGEISAAGSVSWATAEGTAVAGSDYTSDGGTLDWTAGDGSDKTIDVDILDDALLEADENFTVVLSNPGGNAFIGEPSVSTVTIHSDEVSEVLFSTSSYAVGEGDGTATITAWRTGAVNGAVTVGYATTDGTATAGSDYNVTSGTLSWADGDAAPTTFGVPLLDDGNMEFDETVLLALSNPTGGATIGTPGTAVLTIEDNDGTLLQFTSASFNVDETGGSAVISIERFGSDTSGAVTVGFATVDGIAIDGRDYVATSGTLSWADGETADQSFSVTILDDSLLEGPETLTLTLSNPTGNAGLGTPATADLTIGDDDAGETLINTETSGPQTRPDTAIAPDGSSVVVWESYLQDGAGWGIFGQRFDPAGSPAGPEFQVNSTTGGDQRYAAVAMAPGGAFTVVWHGSDASGDGICGRRFNSAGAPLGAEYVVNTTTAGDQIEPDVAVDGTGAALVVWQSDQTGNLEIRGRAYTSAGAATGNEFAVNTTTANDQQLPSVAGSAGGGFVVAWQSYGQDGPAEGIFARRVSSSGSPAGAEAMVNQWTSGNQIAPSVGQTAAGSFLVAWEDTGHQDGMGSSIRARWFSATAVPQGGDIQVNTHWMNNQTQPGVASDGAGSVTIVWESEDQDGSDLGIYSRTMDGSGAFISPEIRFNSFVTGIQNRPAVARVDTGAYWVVWASGGQDGSGDGIFGVFGAAPPTPEVFADGFESGDTSAWSSSSP